MTSKTTDQFQGGMTVSLACLTDTGRVRQANEDAFVIVDLDSGELTFTPCEQLNFSLSESGLLMAVSDGMGGARAGEVASRLAVEQLVRRLRAPAQASQIEERLRDGIKSSHRAIKHTSEEIQDYRGMGATMTAALIYDGRAYFGQVGDSRGYLMRNGQIEQITKDQSLAQALIDIGQLTEDDSADLPQRHVILQALGVHEEIEPEVSVVALSLGDHIILCSDYLSQKVTKVEMLNTIREAGSLNAACARLVALANERGGEDNITILIAHFDGITLPEPQR
jgi:serine/threonine protein phosphatase PrpC